MFTVRLLTGTLLLERDGEPVGLPRQQRRLLSLLAMRARLVPREQLEENLGLSRGALRTTIARLRSEVGSGLIASESEGYRLEASEVDVQSFEDEIRLASSGSPEERIEGLSQALARWSGEPLHDVSDDAWAQPEIVRLLDLRAAGEEDLAELLRSAGRSGEAIALMRTNISRNPFRDRPREILLKAMATEGRHTEAMREFQEYRRLLAEEIGTEPSAELVMIDRRVALGETFGTSEANIAPSMEPVDSSPPLPTGLLTYMFTDIAGSTALWSEDQTKMSVALELHDATLQSAIEESGGHVVKHTGDGMMAVFQEPSAAAAAAISTQQRIELPVRIGLHCGVAVQRGNDYFGSCVSRTAGLMDLANPGQVLVSADLIPFLEDVDVRDLGRHNLPGLKAPESVFQLEHPTLRSRFPPLRSAATTPNNLPQSISALIGRSADADAVLEHVTTRRMVSLRGIGGSGKTRLAIEVARRALDHFRDGVYFVGLAPITNEDQIAAAVARSVGTTDVPDLSHEGRSTYEFLADELEGRNALIVLDNCEHLGAGPAIAAETLLSRTTELHILATSRDVLGVPGEVVYRTPPLSIKSAVKLFVDRARAVRPSLSLTDATVTNIAHICRRLDQLPLAIELAAAQVMAMEPLQILERLDSANEMVGATKSTSARHRTLGTAIRWSYETLSPHEKDIFSRLSVFAGDFSIEAAEFVAAQPDESSSNGFAGVVGALVALVSKSLIEADTETGRYRLLQIVQQFASAELAGTPAEEAARERHAAFYTTRAQEHRRDVYNAGIGPDLSDLANMRLVADYHISRGEGSELLAFIAAGHEYWSHAGAAFEIEGWLKEARSMSFDDIDIDLRVEALCTVASALTIARPQGSTAIELSREAVALSKYERASPRTRYLAASDLGYAYVQSDASDPRGREWLTRSLEFAVGNPVFEMRSYGRLSVAAFIGENQALGLVPAERAYELARDAGLVVFERVALAFRGATRAAIGDDRGARHDLEQLNELPEDLDPVWRGTILVTAANGWLQLGDQRRALERLVPALDIPVKEIGDVIATMITTTTCMIEELSPSVVASAIGAAETFHSSSQPMLRRQLESARVRTTSLLGEACFGQAYGEGRETPLQLVHGALRSAIPFASRDCSND